MKIKLLSPILVALALMVGSNTQAATGGPDSYGYTWIDSNEPAGPIYNWIEIATPAGGSGTLRTAVACDDCHEANIPLGFNFPFYGVNSNTISIGSNGVVYFENVYLGLANVCMPGTPGYTMAQYKFIAHLWDDLAPNYQGGIYTQAFPNYFVIEYYDIVPCCSAGDGDTWQVILFRNGNILMQYKELSNQGLQSDFTVGIQNNPTTGLQYKCDAAGIPLANNRAILFSPPTFSCGSVSQNILGTNPGFCTGSSVVLSAGATSIAQAWSTGPTTSTITVNTVGTYSIYLLDTNGCTIRDTAMVVENPLPVVNLGSDVTQCGGSVVLDAGNAGANFLWSDNSTAQTLSASTSGTYSVVVTDPLTTCSKNDTISVTINALPVVTLGNDISQCEGTVVLDAGNAGSTYLWNENSTTQTITVSSSGFYAVTVTDPVTTCSANDTILVMINTNPTVALGSDIAQCGGSVILDAGNAGSNFLWSDNSTAQTLSVNASGSYNVMVTDPLTGCMNSDTIMVAINAIPVVVLGTDITQCGGFVVLDAGNAGMNYSWSDSSVAQTLTVGASGAYYVMVTDPVTGCMSSDTIMVMINAEPTVTLGADVIQCGGTVVLNAGNSGMSYLWSDNSTGQTLTVSASGTYYVTVTDSATCSGSDTVDVVINAVPSVTFTLATSTVCVDDGSFALAGGSPAGGTYSGTGVSAGMFSPGTAGTGPHVITYTYVDQATGCVNSATQTVAVNACVGIVEQAADGIHVYPNPTSGILVVETSVTESTIEVYNAVGELVESRQVNTSSARVDLSARENGIYFIRVVTATGTHMEKIVLQQ